MQFQEGNYNFAYIRISDTFVNVSQHRCLPDYDEFNNALSNLLSAKLKQIIARDYGYKPVYDFVNLHHDIYGQLYFNPELRMSGWNFDPIIGSIVILESPVLHDMHWLNQGACFKHASQSFKDKSLSYFVWENDCADVASLRFEGSKMGYDLFVEPIIGIYPSRPYAEFNLIMY